MKIKLVYFAIVSLVFVLSMQSCIDKGYDFDSLNKNSEFKIPPVPLGNIDSIKLFDLPPVGGLYEVRQDTIKGLFGGSAVKKFFYDGADGVALQGVADVELKYIKEGSINVAFVVIDKDGLPNQGMKIPDVELNNNEKGQLLAIKFPAEGMAYMANAKDLLLTITVKAGSVSFHADDYIYIKEIVIKTGGIYFEF